MSKKKYIVYLTAALCSLLSLLIFACLWRFSLSEITQKSKTLKLNDQYSAYTQPIKQKETLSQSFKAQATIYGMGIIADTSGCHGGEIVMEIFDENGDRIAVSRGKADDMKGETYGVFNFDTPLKASESLYTMALSLESADENQTVAFAKGDKAVDLWKLSRDENAQNGTLAMIASTNKIGSFARNYYICFAVLSSALIGALYLLTRAEAVKIHIVTFIAILLLGGLYNMILPAYSAPDEEFHINQAFNNSSVLLSGIDAGQIKWGTNYKRADDFNEICQDKLTTVYTYREFYNNAFTLSSRPAGESVAFNGEEVGGYNLPYVLSGLTVTVCRLLKLGFVPTLTLARFANLLFYAAVAALAVKFMPYNKGIIAVTALFPMSLHLAMSFSRDGFTISMALLLISMCLYGAKSHKKLSVKFLAALAAVVVLFAPSKSVYIPLCFLILIIPYDNFKNKAQMLGFKIGTLTLAVFNYLSANGAIVENILRKLNSTSQVVQVGTQGYVNPDSITYTLGYILQFPGKFAALLVNTVLEKGEFYLKTLFGGSLGYFNTEISWAFIIIFILLAFMAAAAAEGEDSRLKPLSLGWVGLIMLGVCALAVYGCISWTPLYYKTIYGLQGRYFLPVFPLFLLLLKNKAIKVTRDLTANLIFIASAANILVLLNAFCVISAR